MIKIKKNQVHSLRFFAILGSFLLWLYVLSSADTQIEKKVKLNYILPDGYSLANLPPSNVIYNLKGPRAIIRNIQNKDIGINVNIRDIFISKKLQYNISIINNRVSFPFGIEIVGYGQKNVQVSLEKTMTKKVAVKFQTFGRVPVDHKVTYSFLNPKSISIYGPTSIIKNIDHIDTQVFDWSSLTQSGNEKILLRPKDARVKLSVDYVDFKYDIQPTRANLLIKNVPINFLTRRVFSRADSRSANIMVLADNSESIAVLKRKIKLIAEIPHDATGEVKVKLKADLPDGLHLLEVTPEEISVLMK